MIPTNETPLHLIQTEIDVQKIRVSILHHQIFLNMSDDESHNQTFEQVSTRRYPSPILDHPAVMTIDIRLMLERLLLTLCNALPCVKTVTSSLKVNHFRSTPDIPT